MPESSLPGIWYVSPFVQVLFAVFWNIIVFENVVFVSFLLSFFSPKFLFKISFTGTVTGILIKFLADDYYHNEDLLICVYAFYFPPRQAYLF